MYAQVTVYSIFKLEKRLTKHRVILFNTKYWCASSRSTQLPKGDLVGPLIDFGRAACSAPSFLFIVSVRTF